MSGTTARISGLPPSVSLRQTRSTPDRITPETCTCGAKLAGNARFCHLCGRPVFTPEIPEVVEPPSPPAFAQTGAAAGPRGGLAQLPVSFSNPIALRVAFLMSLGVMLMTMVPVMYVLSPIWWLVAGLCAVLLYRRQTGVSLSVRAGARLGSITGVLAFLSLVVIIALTVVFAGKDLFDEMARQNPEVSRAALNNRPALVVAGGIFLVFLFAIVVGTCAAGGALGARFAARNAKV
jgi:hypothetical protein